MAGLPTIRWFHLSDWHIVKTPDREAKEMFTCLIEEARKITKKFQANIVFHTGDIVFSGKKEEYVAAAKFLKAFMAAVRLKREALFLVPGNHDVEDAKAIDAKSLEESFDEKTYTDGVRDWYDSEPNKAKLLKKLRAFHNFCARAVPSSNHGSTHRPWFAARLKLGADAFVGVVGLNSVFISRKDDATKGRRMIIGRWQIRDAMEHLEAQGATLANLHLIHHPFTELREYDRRQCIRELGDRFQIGFNGHTHSPEDEERRVEGRFIHLQLTGAGYQGSHLQTGYSYGEYNSKSGRAWVKYRKWSTSRHTFVDDTDYAEGGKKTFDLSPKVRHVPVAARIFNIRGNWINRGGLALPRSGLERLSVSAGYIDRESHRNQAQQIEYYLTNQRILPSKYLFWHAASRAMYFACLEEPDYTLARDSEFTFRRTLPSFVGHIMAKWPKQRITFVSLGVGAGTKEKWLLEEIRQRSPKTPVCLQYLDINEQMLQWGGEKLGALAEPSRTELTFVHGDFERIAQLGKILPDSKGPTIFLMLGGTFGNQDELSFLESLSRVADGKTYLYFGVPTTEALAKKVALKGYSSEVAFRFAELTLKHFDPRYAAANKGFKATSSEIMSSSIANAETITVAAESPTFGRVHLGVSNRYDVPSLKRFLQRCGATIQWDSAKTSGVYWKCFVKIPRQINKP